MTEAPERIWAFEERGSRWHYGHWDLCGPGDYERIEYLRADLVPGWSDRVEALETENAWLREALMQTARADDLREAYHRLPNDHCRPGQKKSPKSVARDAWLRAFRRAARQARAALNKEMTDEGE